MIDATNTAENLPIAIAADHAAIHLKSLLKTYLKTEGYTVMDLGTHGPESVDYPDYADAMADALESGKASRGILLCGSGIGISIAANRHRHIRAALCDSGLAAKLSRQHNNANVLVMGARLIGEDVAKECADMFLKTEFEGGRHMRRVTKMS